MECPLEQVLYRDQRTIKTIRSFNDLQHLQHQNCRRCQQQESKVDYRFLLDTNHHQGCSCVSAASGGSVYRIQGGSNSSLYCNNCHNQYFWKSKRLLYQTEVQCGVQEASVGLAAEVSEKKIRGHSWFKKFHNVLLLSTYLSLLAFPYASAVPTTISSRTTAFWNSRNSGSNPKESSQNTMNLTALVLPYRSANSAFHRAQELSGKFRKDQNTDPKVVYAETPAYSWLPKVPTPGSSEFETHVNSLELTEFVDRLFSDINIIRVGINELEIDFKDCKLGKNISEMGGALSNIVSDLEPEKDTSIIDTTIMPDVLRNLNKTDRIARDWLIIRALVEYLEYTVAVFKHFDVPYDY